MALKEISSNTSLPTHRSCVACNIAKKVKCDGKSKHCNSKNVLDVRIVHGHPQQAWIECYNNSYDVYAQSGKAERDALKEGLKLQEYQVAKQAKLKKFRQDVSKRVSYIQKLKQKEAEKKSQQLMEEEESALRQRIQGIKFPSKENCIVATSTRIVDSNNETLNVDDTQEENDTYNVQNNEQSEANENSLNEVMPCDDTWRDLFAVKPLTRMVKHTEENMMDNSTKENPSDITIDECSNQWDVDSQPRNKATGATDIDSRRVQLTRLQKNIVHDDALISQDNDMREKMMKSQYWKLRKLFMNIEREQVKHNKVKQQLDVERRRSKLKKFSQNYNYDVYATQPITYQPLPQFTDIQTNDVKPTATFKKEQKRKELVRYMEALRATAKQRFGVCNIKIPNLCECADEFWDTHPDVCEKECMFHNNHSGYIKALTTTLATTR